MRFGQVDPRKRFLITAAYSPKIGQVVAHLLEIALWAVVFIICGEFHDFGIAYYHSAVNYTSLGYDDVVLAPSWRLLGPFEAANGLLLFGLSTAMIFAVI